MWIRASGGAAVVRPFCPLHTRRQKDSCILHDVCWRKNVHVCRFVSFYLLCNICSFSVTVKSVVCFSSWIIKGCDYICALSFVSLRSYWLSQLSALISELHHREKSV